MARALAGVHSVPGRMERFVGNGCTVIVDYAHTPDALERVLQAAREAAPTRLTVVFGCGGERDTGKRALMGAIAERLSDQVILTNDNPRSEVPQAIVEDIVRGMQQRPLIQPDRAQAIHQAIAQAMIGETLIIAGKGAETEQVIGTERHLFDDRAIVREALAQR